MPTQRPRPQPTPLPNLSAGQRALVKHYQASRGHLKALAAQVGASHTMLRRELLGVRHMPPERVAALQKLLPATPRSKT